MLVIAAWAAQTYLAPQWHKATRFHAPYDRIAHEIRAAGFTHGTIVADGLHLAGNLRLFFPEARVLTPAYAHYLPPARPTEPCLLAWEGSAALPDALQDYLVQHGQGRAEGLAAQAQARYRYSETETMTVGYLQLPAGRCP
jgi:hypothetical protein